MTKASTPPPPEYQQIVDRTSLRPWRIEVPNLVDDSALSPFEFRLLIHYLRVGTCTESTRTTAKRCRMSVGKVSAARLVLRDGGWITLEEVMTRRGLAYRIEVVDVWERNFAHYTQQREAKRAADAQRSLSERSATPDPASVHSVNGQAGVVHQVNGESALTVHSVKQRILINESIKGIDSTPPAPGAGEGGPALPKNKRGLDVLEVQAAFITNHRPPNDAAAVAAEFGDTTQAEFVKVFVEETGVRYSRQVRGRWWKDATTVMDMGYTPEQFRAACRQHCASKLGISSLASVFHALPKDPVAGSAQAAIARGTSVSAVNAQLNRGRR